MMNETVKCSDCGKSVSRWGVNGYGRCTPCQTEIEKVQAARIAAQPKIEIKTGDRVAIKRGGRRYTGTVSEAQNWGGSAGWYIQFTHDDKSEGRRGEPGYWKQGCDGGTVEVLEKRDEIERQAMAYLYTDPV